MRSITNPVVQGILLVALSLSAGACGGGPARPVPATDGSVAVTSGRPPELAPIDAELARLDEQVAEVGGQVDDISIPDTEGDLP